MSIEIIASARLHLGFYNYYELNTMYGGIGVAIDRPRVKVVVEKSDQLIIENKSGIYVDDVVENVLNALDIRRVKIKIASMIPRHIGLGSTTQLALSLGYGVSKLYNLGYSVRELASLLKRGYVSGIGIGVFEHGGLIIDSGRKTSNGKLSDISSTNDLPYTIMRYNIPKNWYFIVLTPSGVRGMDEVKEKKLLEKPKPLPPELQFKLYRTLLLELIPAIIRGDARLFGKALMEIQFTAGQYFSKYQGGIFCCKKSENIANKLLEHGVYGIGQSSWGPSIYGVIDNYEKAKHILRSVLRELRDEEIELSHVFIAKPRNRGARIRTIH